MPPRHSAFRAIRKASPLKLFHPPLEDGTRLIYAGTTVGNQPKMVIVEIGSGRVIKSFFGDSDVETLDLSPDGQLIAFGDLTGVARIFGSNGRLVRILTHRSRGRVKDL